ncbi:MAG: hypothetical protein KDA28_14640, partial [Phycisphaerales bacterium]|nr:hypothetical protein [Phycisphaerales bacterium]
MLTSLAILLALLRPAPTESVTLELRSDVAPPAPWVILWTPGPEDGRDAWTDIEGRTWVRAAGSHPGYPRESETRFTFDVEPGVYLATATAHDATTRDPTPAGMSEVFTVGEGDEPLIPVEILGGIPMTLHIIDRETKAPIEGIPFRLVSDHGVPVVHGNGNAVLLDRTDASGSRHMHALIPGTYGVDVFTREARVNDFVRYNDFPSRTMIHVRPGAINEFFVEAEPRFLTPEEIDAQFPFSARGRVTDPEGHPLPDVEVRVATGMGTLHGGGTVRTDQDGRYVVHFTPGMWRQDGGVGVQAAAFFVHKDGWFETSLCRQGNAIMSDLEGEALRDGAASWGIEDPSRIARPGTPLEIDFVMSRAARVTGRLVTAQGRAVANASFSVEGEVLPPASSVLTTFETDEKGR